MVYIYGLFDPRNGECKYVGKTNNLKNRFKHHMQCRDGKKKIEWIKELKSIGLKPEIDVIDIVDNWTFFEQWYMDYFRSIGCNLTNIALGGFGNKEEGKGYNHTEYQREYRKKNKDKMKLWQSYNKYVKIADRI